MFEPQAFVRPRGRAVVTFSNRCFPTKAGAIWQTLNGDEHLALVSRYFEHAGWNAKRP